MQPEFLLSNWNTKALRAYLQLRPDYVWAQQQVQLVSAWSNYMQLSAGILRPFSQCVGMCPNSSLHPSHVWRRIDVFIERSGCSNLHLQCGILYPKWDWKGLPTDKQLCCYYYLWRKFRVQRSLTRNSHMLVYCWVLQPSIQRHGLRLGQHLPRNSVWKFLDVLLVCTGDSDLHLHSRLLQPDWHTEGLPPVQ